MKEMADDFAKTHCMDILTCCTSKVSGNDAHVKANGQKPLALFHLPLQEVTQFLNF